MQKTVFLAAALLLAGAAPEIPANRRALDEGATLLSDACEIANPGDAKTCRRLQDTFLLNYIRAMAGDTLSMKNLACYFGQPMQGEVAQSKLRSCAWAMMAELSVSPTEDGSSVDGMIDAYCKGLPKNDFVSAKHYASITSARIERSPAVIPRDVDGDGWPGEGCDEFTVAYAARGQFAPPRCKPFKGHLDSSVSRLVP